MSAPLLPPELSRLRKGEIFVNESFHSIQGESTHAGRPCFFIRLAGCHLRCGWCDTEYAFHAGKTMTVDACVAAAAESGCNLVEVTGGEPLLQKAVYRLMEALCERGHEVLLETSGALSLERVDARVKRIVDWKCPGSGMASHNKSLVLRQLVRGDELKLVILDRADYEWARSWMRATTAALPDIGRSIPVHFSPVFGRCNPSDLAAWILDDRLPVRLTLQLHKSIWSPETRGV